MGLMICAWESNSGIYAYTYRAHSLYVGDPATIHVSPLLILRAATEYPNHSKSCSEQPDIILLFSIAEICGFVASWLGHWTCNWSLAGSIPADETTRFFKRQVLPGSSVLHYLLPRRRNNDTVNKLRNAKPLDTFQGRTNKSQKLVFAYTL